MARHNFRGDFKVQDRITTTISPDLQLLAWKKAIRWSEALEVGIKQLANVIPTTHDPRETIVNETDEAKIEQYKRALSQMQERIDVLLDKKEGN